MGHGQRDGPAVRKMGRAGHAAGLWFGVALQRIAALWCGARGVEVTIERVAYDAEAVAREVAAVGLPSEYADKLLMAA